MSTALRKPINKTGAATKRWARWTASCRDAVLKRNMRLRFGLCDVPGCKNRYQDLAHLFGRAGTGARLGEPWCSLPELCLALCREHHNQIDRHAAPELLAELRWQAMDRLGTRFAQTWIAPSDPMDAIRFAVDGLDKTFTFDPQTLQFTRKEAA